MKTETVEFEEDTAIRIWETAQSGAVILSSNEHSAYGSPEVYLTIRLKDGSSKYLSAAVSTDIVIDDVVALSLSVLYPIPPGIQYTAFVNAHCIYEVL